MGGRDAVRGEGKLNIDNHPPQRLSWEPSGLVALFLGSPSNELTFAPLFKLEFVNTDHVVSRSLIIESIDLIKSTSWTCLRPLADDN